MNLRVYKGFGIFLIIFTSLVILSIMSIQISNTTLLTRDYFDYLWEIAVEGFLPSILVFILGFYPGIFYYRFGRDEKEHSGLVRLGFWLNIVAVILIVLVSITMLISCINGCSGLGEGVLFVMVAIPALIIYCISLVLLIIYKFKEGNWKFLLVEKISFGIIILLLIVSGIVYYIGMINS